MRIIDTHCHLIYLDQLRYPWLDSVPQLNRDFTLERYRAEAVPAGITDTIHMEVDVAEDDIENETAFVTGLGNGIVAAIAACRPENDDFADYLERVAANPVVKGLRRVLHTRPDEVSQRPEFAQNLRRLAAHQLSFDLCIRADQLPVGVELVKACPDVQFILDHCGVPNVKDQALDPWREHIGDIARLPNIACKISGVVAYADPDVWTKHHLRPFVEHCIEVFGWDRVVWGSDWPVCTLTADLTSWVAATHELVEHASLDEREKLLFRNAERIYRLT